MPIYRCRTILVILSTTLILVGCAAIRVQPAEGPTISGAWSASSFSESALSMRTRQTLRRLDLETVYDANPAEVPAKLHAMALGDPRPELLFALAEVYYVRGAKAEKKGEADAFVAYYLSAGYAYHFLFDEARESLDIRTLGGDDSPSVRSGKVFDPRFRLACDLFNLGVAKCIIAAQRVGRFDPRSRLVLPARDGSQTIKVAVVHHGYARTTEDIDVLVESGAPARLRAALRPALAGLRRDALEEIADGDGRT